MKKGVRLTTSVAIFLLVLSPSFLVQGCFRSQNAIKKSSTAQEQAVKNKVPELHITPILHDFGTISQFKMVKTSFNLSNSGDKTLKILNIITS